MQSNQNNQQGQMQQGQMQQGQQGQMNPEAFSESYLDKKTGVLIFVVIVLIIGSIMFLQVCCVQMTGSGASGLAGSSAQSSGGDGTETEYNTYCAGFAEFLAVILIAIGVYMLANIMTKKNDAEKLTKEGHLLAAISVDGKEGIVPTNDLIQKQITINEQMALSRGMEIHHLDVETDDEDEDEE